MPLGGDGTVLALSRPRDDTGAGEEVDAGFLAAFAAQCAQALERARLHDAERDARQETEALQTATEALAAAGGRQDVAETIVQRGHPHVRRRRGRGAPAGARRRAACAPSPSAGSTTPWRGPPARSALDEDVPTVAAARPARRSSPRTRPRWPAPPRRRRPAARVAGARRAGRPAAAAGRADRRRPGAPLPGARGRSGRPSATRSARSRAWRRCRWCAPACTRARPAAARTPTCWPTSARPSTPSWASPAGSTALRELLVPRWADGCVISAPGADGGMRAAIGADRAGGGAGSCAAAGRGRSTRTRARCWAATTTRAGRSRRSSPPGCIDAGHGGRSWRASPPGCSWRPSPRTAGRPARSRSSSTSTPAGCSPSCSRRRRSAAAWASRWRTPASTRPRSTWPPPSSGACCPARLAGRRGPGARGPLPDRHRPHGGGRRLVRGGRAAGRRACSSPWATSWAAAPSRPASWASCAARCGPTRSRGFGPRAVLEHLSRFAAGIPGAEVSTAACVEIDPQSDRVTYACAGHPHPVVVERGRRRPHPPRRTGPRARA